jgi:hypothetical protein
VPVLFARRVAAALSHRVRFSGGRRPQW